MKQLFAILVRVNTDGTIAPLDIAKGTNPLEMLPEVVSLIDLYGERAETYMGDILKQLEHPGLEEWVPLRINIIERCERFYLFTASADIDSNRHTVIIASLPKEADAPECELAAFPESEAAWYHIQKRGKQLSAVEYRFRYDNWNDEPSETVSRIEYVATVAEAASDGEMYGAIFNGSTPEDVFQQVVAHLKNEADYYKCRDEEEEGENGEDSGDGDADIDYDPDELQDCIRHGNESQGPLCIEIGTSSYYIYARPVKTKLPVEVPVYIATRDSWQDAVHEVEAKGFPGRAAARNYIKEGFDLAMSGCLAGWSLDELLEDGGEYKPDHICVYDDDSNGFEGKIEKVMLPVVKLLKLKKQ